MDVLQTKHSSRPDSSPIHTLFLNGLFCSVGTQVEMKISAGGGGALAREVQISELRFTRGDSLGFPFFFGTSAALASCLPLQSEGQTNGCGMWNFGTVLGTKITVLPWPWWLLTGPKHRIWGAKVQSSPCTSCYLNAWFISL